jgi:hypothetical protein
MASPRPQSEESAYLPAVRTRGQLTTSAASTNSCCPSSPPATVAAAPTPPRGPKATRLPTPSASAGTQAGLAPAQQPPATAVRASPVAVTAPRAARSPGPGPPPGHRPKAPPGATPPRPSASTNTPSSPPDHALLLVTRGPGGPALQPVEYDPAIITLPRVSTSPLQDPASPTGPRPSHTEFSGRPPLMIPGPHGAISSGPLTRPSCLKSRHEARRVETPEHHRTIRHHGNRPMLFLILMCLSGPRSPAHSEADRLVPVSAHLHLGEVAQAVMALHVP